MKLHVHLFAVAKERLGTSQVAVELPEGASLGQLRAALAEFYPPLREVLRHARLAVNNEYAADTTPLAAGAEVALIPPVSGG
jgi:molybdopterin converting factor subunit 1